MKNTDEENKYGYDQFGYPITKEDVKFNITIGIIGGITFVVGLILVTM